MKGFTPLILSLLALVLSIFSFFYFQNSTADLVYVDINKLLDGYERTAVEKSKFQAKASKMQANVDSLLGSWQLELKQYEKERSSLSKRELELKQELLSNKQQQLTNYQQAIQKQMQEEDHRATQTVINEINEYVKEFGKENNYKIIFGASGSGTIMYADESTDLTQIVLDGLNEQYKE